MEYNKKINLICIAIVLVLTLSVTLVLSLDLSKEIKEEILSKKNLSSQDPKQVDILDRLDSSYIIDDSGVYFKALKQTNPIVWIDKKVKDVYHVDSRRDFVENESVTLKFFYDIQPDYIKHITHSGKYDKTYFPTQWDWESNCSGEQEEQICQGGWVTIEVENIEEGYGSSTFPIGITGPTWANDGQFFGEFDGSTSVVSGSNTISAYPFTLSAWLRTDDITSDSGVLGIGVTNVENRYFLMGFSNSKFEINARTSINNYPREFGIPLNDVWYHMLVVFQNSTYREGFINGVSGTIDTRELDFEAGINTYVAGVFRLQNPSGQFNGFSDELLIYNRSLSQVDITELYSSYSEISTGINRTGSINTTDLVLDINFDDFSVADNSGQGNHGTNTNVSFGVVEDVEVTLVENTDYSISGSTFNILNTDYAWKGIDASWIYDGGQYDEFGFHVSIVKLTAGFVALALLTFVILYLFKILREEGIIN